MEVLATLYVNIVEEKQVKRGDEKAMKRRRRKGWTTLRKMEEGSWVFNGAAAIWVHDAPTSKSHHKPKLFTDG